MTDSRSFDLTRFPEYRDATQKLTEVQLELAAVEQRRDALLLDLSRHVPASLTQQAETLLTGGTLIEQETKPLHDELSKLQARKRVLEEAIRLQRRHVETLTFRYAERICQNLRPDYLKIVQRVAATVAELGEALDEEREFREVLADQGVPYASYLRPMPFFGVGGLRDPSNPHTNAVLCLSEVRGYYPEAFPEGVTLPPGLPSWDTTPLPTAPRKGKAADLEGNDWR